MEGRGLEGAGNVGLLGHPPKFTLEDDHGGEAGDGRVEAR